MGASKRRIVRRFRGAALLSLGLSLAGLASSIVVEANESTATRAVPAYFSDEVNWAFLESNAAGVELAVMNPDSGPGASKDQSWVDRLARVGLTNPSIVGYVDTTYAVRPLATVLAEIDQYKSWYGVSSIFLDQVPSNCVSNSYFSTVSSKIRQNGGIVVVNPGVLPQNCVVDLADIVVSFEGNATDYQGSIPANPSGYSPRKFWHLVYAVPQGEQRSIEDLARRRGAGFVYATSDLMPNPWSRVDPFPPALIGGAVASTSTTVAGPTSTTVPVTVPPSVVTSTSVTTSVATVLPSVAPSSTSTTVGPVVSTAPRRVKIPATGALSGEREHTALTPETPGVEVSPDAPAVEVGPVTSAIEVNPVPSPIEVGPTTSVAPKPSPNTTTTAQIVPVVSGRTDETTTPLPPVSSPVAVTTTVPPRQGVDPREVPPPSQPRETAVRFLSPSPSKIPATSERRGGSSARPVVKPAPVKSNGTTRRSLPAPKGTTKRLGK